MRPHARHRWVTVLLCACAALLASSGAAAQAGSGEGESGKAPAPADVLRVCADPDNLPQSNQRGEGYENKIAEQLARDLGRRLEYTYFPQRMGFVRHTLREKDPATQEFRCDVIIGVPKGYELAATTRPYMRSTYALVFRLQQELQGVRTANDVLKLPARQLRSLRIGVFGRSPGTDWLLRNNLIDQAVFYTPQSGDPAENPAQVIERDLEAGTIDMAIVWGPVAGFLVSRHSASPAWATAPFTLDREIRFDYEIAMGVRFGEGEWKNTLDQWIAAHEQNVHEILTRFSVPLLDADGEVRAGFSPHDDPHYDPHGGVRAGSNQADIPLQLQRQ